MEFVQAYGVYRILDLRGKRAGSLYFKVLLAG
jgi:hypothetical protein